MAEKKATNLKKTKLWKFETVQSRTLAAKLTEMSAAGEEVFAVYASMIAGSFDVLSYRAN